MANYVVSDTNLTLIADAIRAKSGHNELLEWPNEYKTSIDNLNPVDMCIKTTTDDVVSVNDAAQYDAKNVSIKIEPVQDLNGYDSPWPAGGGKNLLNPSNVSVYMLGQAFGLTWIWDSATGAATVSGTWNQNSTGGAFRLLNVPSTVRETCNITAFSDSANFNLLRWQSGEDVAVLNLKNMVENQSYSFKVYPVAYVGSTAPTSWTPYSNVCPISGWTGAQVVRTGANVWDEEWEVGAYNVSTGVKSIDGARIRNKNFISVVGGQSYYLRLPYVISTYGAYLFKYDSSQTYISGGQIYNGLITLESNVAYINFCTQPVYGTTYNNDISINYPHTDHDYHQSHTQSLPITFPSEAGTVYGGTLDVTNGVLTVERAYASLASVLNKFEDENGYYWFSTSSTFGIPIISGLNAGLISDRFVKIINVSTGDNDGVITFYANGIIRWKEKGDLALADYRTYLASNPFQLCYELATPVTYTLTPQQIALLRGNNNVWADTGDTTLKYFTTAFEDLAEEIGFAEGGDY